MRNLTAEELVLIGGKGDAGRDAAVAAGSMAGAGIAQVLPGPLKVVGGIVLPPAGGFIGGQMYDHPGLVNANTGVHGNYNPGGGG